MNVKASLKQEHSVWNPQSPYNHALACWPVSDRTTEPVNIGLFSSRSSDIQHLSGLHLCGTLHGWVANLSTSTVHVCLCVLMRPCVGVCQIVSSGAYKMWAHMGFSQLGWMNCSVVKIKTKPLVYLSARCCVRPGTLTKWLRSHFRLYGRSERWQTSMVA